MASSVSDHSWKVMADSEAEYFGRPSITKEVRWSTETYSMQDVIEKFQSKFPLFIMVVSGYYGNTELDTFASEQMMRIHSVFSQKRVLVKVIHPSGNAKMDQYVSIPENCGLYFDVLEGSSGKNKPLSYIIERLKLPLKVCFSKSYIVDFYNKQKQNNPLGHMKSSVLQLEEVFYSQHLIVNTVNNQIMSQTITPVPMYIALTVTFGIGVENGTEDEWKQLKKEYADFSSLLCYTNFTGNPDLAYYDSKHIVGRGEEKCGYIEPNSFFKYSKKKNVLPQEPLPGTSEYSYVPENEIEALRKKEEDENTIRYTPEPTKQKSVAFVGELQSKMKKGKNLLLGSFASKASKPRPPLPPKPMSRFSTINNEEKESEIYDDLNEFYMIPELEMVEPVTIKDQVLPFSPATPPPRKKEVKEMDPDYEAIMAVPEDLSSLSIDEIARCLSLLKLEKYIPSFKEELVDGSLLMDLDEQALKDFGLSPFQSQKLVKFIKGWRPKST